MSASYSASEIDRRVEHVVAVVVLGDLRAQLGVPVPARAASAGSRPRSARLIRSPSSISSGSSRAASRQRASAARAPGRRRAGQAAGRGEHHLAGRRPAARDPHPVPQRRSPRSPMLPRRGAAAARGGRVREPGRRPARTPRPGLDHLGQRILLPAPQQAEVEADRPRPRLLHACRNGMPRRAAVHQTERRRGGQHRAQPVARSPWRRSRRPGSARWRVGTAPASTAGSAGSSSCSSTSAPGIRAAHLGHVRGHPLGQRRGQVGHRAGVGQRRVLAAAAARSWPPASTARRPGS